MHPVKLGILGSTRGTILLPIIEAIEAGRLNAQIKIVISDNPDALILEKARKHNIPAWYVSPQGYSREAYDQMLNQLFADHHVELGVLVGFMRILSGRFTRQWHRKLVNVHPSLLPKYSNMMDLSVHEAVLNSGDEESGCTVHLVEEAVDAGEIILQKRCPVAADDSPLTLKAKVQTLESEALLETIQLFGQGTI
ncbi:MAG: phosphoribosylglycinamide formyltransferase [Gammaproteobacteria bacterium]|nr:phosphoribosylglycinamide formyltransferase [Gammaproteobacteria bacterium]